jgi:hypothetical protein
MNSMRKSIVLLFFVVFIGSAFADSIDNYLVSNQVPLNQNLTVYGVYSGTPSADVLCAFYIFDVKNLDTNAAIIRLRDNYTFSDGSFYFEYKITEPLFQRGIDYNAVSKCGTISIGKVFNVSQKTDLILGIQPQNVYSEFAFWVNPTNSMTAVYGFCVIIFIIICLLVILKGANLIR